MKQRSHKAQAKAESRSAKTGEQLTRQQSIEAEKLTGGILSLAVPVILPLAVLAIVLMATVSTAQPNASTGVNLGSTVQTTSILEGRGAR